MTQACCFLDPFQSTYVHNAFHLCLHIILSDLVLAKFEAVGKTSTQTLLFDRLQYWPHIVWARCHHYETESTLRTNQVHHDVVMVLGLLPIFLHSCEIKSGSGLGMRLEYHTTRLSTQHLQSQPLGWCSTNKAAARVDCLTTLLTNRPTAIYCQFSALLLTENVHMTNRPNRDMQLSTRCC